MVNIGSGGETYGCGEQLHLDLLIERLPRERAVVADAELLPLITGTADHVICVGSVINHLVPETLIAEFGRVTRTGGLLILEFDSTDGLHHTFDAASGAPEAEVQTFYNSRHLVITEYSLKNVVLLLRRAGFVVEHIESFHILSSLALAFHVPPSVAAMLATLDPITRHVRSIRHRGSNIIVAARRS